MCVVLVFPPVEHYEEEAVLNHLHGLQLAPSLRNVVPELVCREIEVAMSKLGLLFDRTYTWDIFSDMMVTLKTSPALFSTVYQLDFTDLMSVLEESAAPCSVEQRPAKAIYGDDVCNFGGLAHSGSCEQHCYLI